jgi:hypothetical protein
MAMEPRIVFATMQSGVWIMLFSKGSRAESFLRNIINQKAHKATVMGQIMNNIFRTIPFMLVKDR